MKIKPWTLENWRTLALVALAGCAILIATNFNTLNALLKVTGR